MVREGRPSWEVWLLDSKVTPRRFTRVLVWPQIRSQCFLTKAFSKIVLCAWTFPSFERVGCWPIDFVGFRIRCSGTWKACVPCCVFQDKRKTFMECLHLFYCWFWDRVSQVVQVSLNPYPPYSASMCWDYKCGPHHAGVPPCRRDSLRTLTTFPSASEDAWTTCCGLVLALFIPGMKSVPAGLSTDKLLNSVRKL